MSLAHQIVKRLLEADDLEADDFDFSVKDVTSAPSEFLLVDGCAPSGNPIADATLCNGKIYYHNEHRATGFPVLWVQIEGGKTYNDSPKGIARFERDVFILSRLLQNRVHGLIVDLVAVDGAYSRLHYRLLPMHV